MTASLPITATIDGRQITRHEVQAWELARAGKVARKLQIDPAGDLATLNERLVSRKLEVGHAGIEQLLARELRLAAPLARATAALSLGRRVACRVDLSSPTGHAEDVPSWYAPAIATGGVRHQFCDRPAGGFDVRLTVEFPLATLPHMVTAHRWHLACEFGNWIETVNHRP